jgi:hypothetical protein
VFEIGNSLREARLRQALEFPEAEQRTKIRAKYLRALEEEQFDVLPAQTYVRGFLRAYAESLGLDGQLYVDEYNSRFVSGDEEHAVRPRRLANPHERRERRFEANIVVLALVAIAVVTALVIAAWKYTGTKHKAAIPAPRAVRHKPVVHKPAKRPAVVTPAAAAKNARLLVAAVRGNSLLEVHAGGASGRLLYHGTLEKGQRQRFVAKRLWLNIGVPENLNYSLNGRRISLGGGAPRVVIVTARTIRKA